MKKLLFAMIILMVCSTKQASAQYQNDPFSIENAGLTASHPLVVGFGPRVGLNIATIMGDGVGDRKAVTGFVGGGTIDFRVSKLFSFSLDITYSSQGYERKSVKERERLSYIIMPVMANFHLDEGGFILKCGVQPSLLMNSILIKGQESRQENTVAWNRFGLDLVPVGIGYMVGRVEFDLRYAFSLTNATKIEGLTYRNSVVSFGMSYKF